MGNLKIIGYGILVLILLHGCNQPDRPGSDSNQIETENAGTEGFNAAASDSEAVAIADSVMQSLGGQDSWSQTNIIQWNFFGRRTHTWNKQTGRDSIYIPSQNLVIDMDLQTKEGTVWKNGNKMTQPDSVQKYLQQGYEMWVNDAYWLLMPYKLKDKGVTLAYMGMDSTQAGTPAHKLKLTFDKVGVTPENMYHVWVDTADYLVRQWAYFPKSNMQEPQFVLPWKDYRQYGEIMLSGDRGQSSITDIKVMKKWPE